MQLEIYADLLFLLNFVIDMVLLYAVSLIRKQHIRWYRLAGAATFGSICACLSAVYGLNLPVIKFLIGYVFCTMLLVFLAFGYHSMRDFLIHCSILVVITFMLGGLIISILNVLDHDGSLFGYKIDRLIGKRSFLIVLTLSILLTPVIVKIFYLQKRLKQERELLYDVDIIIGTHTISCKGLMDTGNHLYEPISRDPVIIVDRELLKDVFIEQSSIRPTSLCFIPFSSVGKEHGILYGLHPDQVIIRYDGSEYMSCHVVCAMSKHDFKRYDYHAILHTELLGD